MCAEGDAMAEVVGAVKEVELAAELTSSIIIIKSNMDPFSHCINYIIIIPFPFELQESMELAHQGNNRCIEEQVKHGELPQRDLLACLRQPLELFIVEDSVTKLEILQQCLENSLQGLSDKRTEELYQMYSVQILSNLFSLGWTEIFQLFLFLSLFSFFYLNFKRPWNLHLCHSMRILMHVNAWR